MRFWHKLVRGFRIATAFVASLTELIVKRPQSRQRRAEWLTRFCRRVLRAANVSWSASGPVPQAGAVITNHLTYVDILVHAALRPCVFVSAIETRQMPLIGWISMMAGTVYVTRGAGGSAAKAASGMVEGFHDGLPVVFFPEGGTSLGDEPVLPLRTGLLATAIEAGAAVTPGFLTYSLSDKDTAAGRTKRADIHWGKQTLPAHLWNFLGLRQVTAHVRFADAPLHFTPAALVDRKIAADEARDVMIQLAQPLTRS